MAPCNCGASAQSASAKPWVVTAPSGATTVHRTEVEAAAKANRVNGTYRQQK